MGSTTYGPTPRLGRRQKDILRVVKSAPINQYHLRNKLRKEGVQWDSGRKIADSDIEKALDGLCAKNLVEFKYTGTYGLTMHVTPKGKAIAARKGVLA